MLEFNFFELNNHLLSRFAIRKSRTPAIRTPTQKKSTAAELIFSRYKTRFYSLTLGTTQNITKNSKYQFARHNLISRRLYDVTLWKCKQGTSNHKAIRSVPTFNSEADRIGFHSFYTDASFVEYVQRYRFLLPGSQVDPSVHTIMIHRNIDYPLKHLQTNLQITVPLQKISITWYKYIII